MKKLFLLFILSFSLFPAEIDLFPEIEKINGVKPWWIEEVSPIEGMIGGIGIVPLNSQNTREAAMEAAKREIAGSKKTYIESEVKLKQNNNNSMMDIESVQKIEGEVKALLIDSWQDSDYFYVWMGEFINRTAYNNLKEYITEKNIKTKENRINIVKYNGKTIVTNKDGGQITITKGSNEGVKVNEVFYVYRLTDESVNPLSNEVEDFSKNKIGEIIIKEVFPESARGEASIVGNFRIQIGDVAYSAGYTLDEKDKEEIEKKEEKMVKYNYDSNYIPKLMNVERAKSLSTRQYTLSLMTDFSSTTLETSIGLFRFFEAGLYYNIDDESTLNFIGKVAFPVNRDTMVGLAYEKNWTNGVEYIMGLFEYQYAEGYGIADVNYKSPLGNASEPSFMGGSIQLQPTDTVILGTEYSKYLESGGTSQFSLKVNLEVMDQLWVGAGVTWSDDRRYFIKVQHLNIF